VAKTEGNSVENEPKGQAKKTNMYVSVYKWNICTKTEAHHEMHIRFLSENL
jgi:hypothetical protein